MWNMRQFFVKSVWSSVNWRLKRSRLNLRAKQFKCNFGGICTLGLIPKFSVSYFRARGVFKRNEDKVRNALIWQAQLTCWRFESRAYPQVDSLLLCLLCTFYRRNFLQNHCSAALLVSCWCIVLSAREHGTPWGGEDGRVGSWGEGTGSWGAGLYGGHPPLSRLPAAQWRRQVQTVVKSPDQ